MCTRVGIRYGNTLGIDSAYCASFMPFSELSTLLVDDCLFMKIQYRPIIPCFTQ